MRNAAALVCRILLHLQMILPNLGKHFRDHYYLSSSRHDGRHHTSRLLRIQHRRDIPEKVLIGYASHNYSNVMQAVEEDGVNIVIWAFMDNFFATSTESEVHDGYNYNDEYESGGSSGAFFSSFHRALNHTADLHGESDNNDTRTQPLRHILPREYFNSLGSLDLIQIKKLIRKLDANGYSHVLHLVSFGGWNGPHLHPPSSSAKVAARMWYSTWEQSTASTIFHGIDWDFEGNDNRSSLYNVFTIACLDTVGEISRLMKEHGYVVTMAPPQSYLNFNTSEFSRYVNLTIPGRRWHADFAYFGNNVYAYLLAAYGNYVDLVSVQLYESYSDAAMAIYHDSIRAEEYLYSFVMNLAIGDQTFYVNFFQDNDLKEKSLSQLVKMELSKLVIGLANGWAVDDNIPLDQRKSLFVPAEDCLRAYDRLRNSEYGDITPRGFMVFTLDERGTRGVYLEKDIGSFLHKE